MKESYADASFEILNDTIQTDGAGTFTGFYSVRVDQDNFANLTEGFVLTEADDGAENWIYDDTQWGVVPLYGPIRRNTVPLCEPERRRRDVGQ